MRSLDGDLEPPGEFRNPSGMVDMTMGHQNFFYIKTCCCRYRLNAVNFASGINNRGLAGLLTTKQGAVLLEWGNGDYLYFHSGGLCIICHCVNYGRIINQRRTSVPPGVNPGTDP